MVIGSQVPRIRSVPAYSESRGHVAVEIARRCGLELDLWQQQALVDACAVGPDGKWAAFEVGLNVARQNGKGGGLEARELAGIVEFGDRLIVHSAHEFATSTVAMDRMEELLEEGGLISLLRDRGGISRSHGSEGFRFKTGQRIWYRTRTKGGGRGFSADLVILDEAMILQEAFIGALMPTMSARSMVGNPQMWYTGSAVDQLVHEHGVVFARLRERGLVGNDPSLVYLEWSGADPVDEFGEPVTPDRLMYDDMLDRARWAAANPGLGIRIAETHVEKELRSMDARTFAVERLGVGDWPATDGSGASVIDMERWNELVDGDSQIEENLCLAFDVSPARTSGAIGAAGTRSDGLDHAEVVEHRRGTGWIVDRLVELSERQSPQRVVCDQASPAASLVPELESRGIEVTLLGASEYAQACGSFFDAVDQGTIRHLGTQELRQAIKGAATRPLNDAWAWSRKSSAVDITPLVTVTNALRGSKDAALSAESEGEVLVAWA